MNTLDACLYCPGSMPRSRTQAKRLRDTRANRKREVSLYWYLTRVYLQRKGGKG